MIVPSPKSKVQSVTCNGWDVQHESAGEASPADDRVRVNQLSADRSPPAAFVCVPDTRDSSRLHRRRHDRVERHRRDDASSLRRSLSEVAALVGTGPKAAMCSDGIGGAADTLTSRPVAFDLVVAVCPRRPVRYHFMFVLDLGSSLTPRVTISPPQSIEDLARESARGGVVLSDRCPVDRAGRRGGGRHATARVRGQRRWPSRPRRGRRAIPRGHR